MKVGLISAAALALFCTAALADPLPSSMEPPGGSLQPGQSKLIDDGTCPPGQIKKIYGGNTKTNARIRTCVSRH